MELRSDRRGIHANINKHQKGKYFEKKSLRQQLYFNEVGKQL